MLAVCAAEMVTSSVPVIAGFTESVAVTDCGPDVLSEVSADATPSEAITLFGLITACESLVVKLTVPP